MTATLPLLQRQERRSSKPRPKLTVSCKSFHPLVRNTLRGFAEITIAELRLTIRDIAIHQKGDARWAQLPAKPQIKDGALVTTDGKIQYISILQFDTGAVRDAFSAAAINAVLALAPDAFDREDAA